MSLAMNKWSWWLGCLVSCLVLAGVATGGEEAPEEAAPPMEFDNYWMVFLERGDDPPELDDEASAKLQRQHLGHLSKVFREGYSLVAGPFEVPAEETLRGIVLFRGDLSEEEVARLANADPAVQAGRLKIRIMKWWTGARALAFPLAEEVASGE